MYIACQIAICQFFVLRLFFPFNSISLKFKVSVTFSPTADTRRCRRALSLTSSIISIRNKLLPSREIVICLNLQKKKNRLRIDTDHFRKFLDSVITSIRVVDNEVQGHACFNREIPPITLSLNRPMVRFLRACTARIGWPLPVP